MNICTSNSPTSASPKPLSEAENDLSQALVYTSNATEKSFIENHIAFLEKLQKTAKKPR